MTNLDSTYRPVFYLKQSFGERICFRLRVKSSKLGQQIECERLVLSIGPDRVGSNRRHNLVSETSCFK
jgi:hypothetical protein